MALVGFLLMTGAPARTTLGKVLDLITLTICNLSGPFCLFLLPTSARACLRSPASQKRDQFVCTLCCSLVQGAFLALTAAQTRSSASVCAGVVAFARIFTNQVEFGLVLGSNAASGFVRSGHLQSGLVAMLMAGLGLSVCLAAAWRGPSVFRMFALFGALVLAASLVSPVVTPDVPAWEVLTRPGAGQRYFLIPMLVLAAAGVVLTGDRLLAVRGVGASLCLATLIGVTGDWSYPRMPATEFNSLARQFAASPSGTEMTFPVYPPDVMPMNLVKK